MDCDAMSKTQTKTANQRIFIGSSLKDLCTPGRTPRQAFSLQCDNGIRQCQKNAYYPGSTFLYSSWPQPVQIRFCWTSMMDSHSRVYILKKASQTFCLTGWSKDSLHLPQGCQFQRHRRGMLRLGTSVFRKFKSFNGPPPNRSRRAVGPQRRPGIPDISARVAVWRFLCSFHA